MMNTITATAGEVVASDLYTLSNYDDLDSLTWHVVGDNVPWSFDRVLSQLRQGYCDYYESSLKLQRGVAALQGSLDAQGAQMLAGSADAVARLAEQVVAMGESLDRMQAQYVSAAAGAASGNVQAAESARCELQAAIGQAKSAASAAQVAEALALTSLGHDLNVGIAETTASIGYSLQDQQSFWNQQKAQSDAQLAKVAGTTSENVRKSSWEKGAKEYKKNLIDEIWKIKRDRILKYIQYALDIASAVVCFIPGVGLVLSVGLRAVSCVISIARGDVVGIAVSLLPMGTIMKGAAKLVSFTGRLLFKPLIQGAAKLMPKAIDVAKGVLCRVGLRNSCFVAGTLAAVPADEDLYLAGGMDDMSGENSWRWDGKWTLVGAGILVLAASAMYALQRRRAKRQGNCGEQDCLPGDVPARPEDRFLPEHIRVGVEDLVFQG